MSFNTLRVGIPVRLVTSEAWEFAATPQLILLDWMLPDQSGLRLLSKIRSDRNFNEIPIIMLTAKSMEEDKIAGLSIMVPMTTSPSLSRREN